MYVTTLEVTVPTTRAVELQRQNDRRLEVLKAQEGFRGCLLLNSLGYPVMHVSPMYFHTTKYILLTEWDHAGAAENWVNSAAWRSFVDRHPSEQLFTPTAPASAYETVDQRSAQGQAYFAWLVYFGQDGVSERAAAQGQAFAALMDLYCGRLEQFVESRLLRSVEDSSQFIALMLLKGETDFPPGQDDVAIRAFLDRHLPDDHVRTHLRPEGFEVVNWS